MFVYDPDDKLAMRTAWVQVCENGYALRWQVAKALGISLRILQYWIARSRKEGTSGLIDKPRCGAPRKVTDALKKRILRLRAGHATVREIAAKCRISIGAVHNVLAKHSEAAVRCQKELTLQEDVSIEECEVVEAPAKEQQLEVTRSCESASEHSLSANAEADEAQDRLFDRMFARLGLINDADALFCPGDNVAWAGVMMAAVILSTSPFLGLVEKIYGHIGPAFYGLRTVMVTYVMMALLRIRRIEDVRRDDPRKLGRVLGLDRVAEVRTLRRKWHKLCHSTGKAFELMEEVGRSRIEELEQLPEVIMVDGHVAIYTGKQKIGEVFSTNANRVVKGRTENWIHIPGGQPLLVLSCPFNEGLSQGLLEAIRKTKELTGQDSITCVFDRGGWSTELWEKIIDAGDHIISYRKGSFDSWGENAFEPGPIQINDKEYAFLPCMGDTNITVYEKQISHKGCKIKYKETKRTLNLKEVRILRNDGKETSILTSRKDLSCEQIASLQFARWGDQENQFKYMLREFDLDAIWMYGTDPVDVDIDHPHPQYTQLQSELRKLIERRKTYLNRIWSSLPDTPETENEAQVREHIVRWMESTGNGNLDELKTIENRIAEIHEKLEKTPAREPVGTAGYKQLKTDSKCLSNVIKIVACDAEGTLAEMITPHYANAHNEKRRLIAAALQTSGSLRLEAGTLVVRLDPQSSPCRTRAVDAICRQLNEYQAHFPGSNRIIRFETDRKVE